MLFHPPQNPVAPAGVDTTGSLLYDPRQFNL